MSSARFKIRNQTTDGAWSLFADEGFDCAPGDVLELKLEDTPALDVWQTVFAQRDRSKGRSLPVFDPASGEATTPTSIVEMTVPSEYGSWEIQCQVNDGADALDSAGRPDATINTKTRIVAIRTAVLQLRHPLASEFTVAEPYDTARAAGVMQEAIDALEAGAGAGGASAAGLYLTDALAAINAGDRPIRGLSSTLNFAGTSAVTPASFAYYRAKGAFGAALKLYRTILGGTGAPDTSTGADLQWWIPNDDVSPTLIEQVRFRPVLTTIAGANLTSDLGLWLVDGGTLTQRFTWHADGSVTWSAYNTAGGRFIVDGSGNITLAAITEAEARTALAAAAGDVDVNGQKITGLAAGGASGEAVEYDQLNTALGGYVPTSRTITAGAGLTGGGDLSADRTLDVAAADASITVNANSIEASGDFVAKAITTTSSVTAGAAGLIAPKWDRANAGPLTLGETNATGFVFSGLPVTKCISVSSDAALGLASGAGDLTLTTAGGDEAHVLDDGQWIRRTWGLYGHEDTGRKHVTSSDATPQNVLTFTIPASSDGTLLLRARQVDVTGGMIGTDHAYYERKIDFARRSGGAAVTSSIGTDIVVPDEAAAWSCTFDVGSLPDVSIRLVGDGANQTEHDVTLIAEYQLFTPA